MLMAAEVSAGLCCPPPLSPWFPLLPLVEESPREPQRAPQPLSTRQVPRPQNMAEVQLDCALGHGLSLGRGRREQGVGAAARYLGGCDALWA